MKNIIQARLDASTKKALEILKQQLGWTDSEIIRKGIKLLLSISAPRSHRKILGLGCVSTGITDLASNKKHLKGFGK